jgi:fructose-bisphosphate aldolase class I
MNTTVLKATAEALTRPGTGILAIDESNGTCDKRLERYGIPATEEMRRVYRQLMLLTPGLEQWVSGAILYDETIRQHGDDGTPFATTMLARNIAPGIKVDTGTAAFDGSPVEKITHGLDGLADRVAEYVKMGARFAKWRAVITIGDGLPTQANVDANAEALAQYARICQDGGLVPIVEPEVLMDGTHSIGTCYETSVRVWHTVFAALAKHGVFLEGIILKPNMIVPALQAPEQVGPQAVASATVSGLLEAVPPEVAGIAFLSGGQSDRDATANLDAINRHAPDAPWPLTFSFGRAFTEPVLDAWRGDAANTEKAQRVLLARARENGDAARGALEAVGA